MTQAYGHSHNSQYFVLPWCTAAQNRPVVVGGGWLGHPSSLAPPMVPAEGGPKIFKLKSSWGRSKNFGCQPLTVEGEEAGGSGGGGGYYGVRPF